jgi:hypothetical protein
MAIIRFPPVGQCIYCGAKDYSESIKGSLADEHIIPLALGGNLLLPEASCRQCERITGHTEQLALQGLYRPLRQRLNYPHRHRGKQPKELPVFIPQEGKKDRRITVPLTEYPYVHFFMQMAVPGLLMEVPLDTPYGPEMRWFRLLATSDSPLTAHSLTTFATPSLDMHSFCRMLAKIGYSLAMATTPKGSFTPLILDLMYIILSAVLRSCRCLHQCHNNFPMY